MELFEGEPVAEYYFPATGWSVIGWSLIGVGRPTEVQLRLGVGTGEHPVILELKSAAEVDELVAVILQCREAVWGAG